jgi:hypothetical protein
MSKEAKTEQKERTVAHLDALFPVKLIKEPTTWSSLKEAWHNYNSAEEEIDKASDSEHKEL